MAGDVNVPGHWRFQRGGLGQRADLGYFLFWNLGVRKCVRWGGENVVAEGRWLYRDNVGNSITR
jgi:hypothetical protein